MPISQNGEAEIVASFFDGYIGNFIDIGASGGVALSNTFELGLKGWHGLFVEASPIHFQNLVTNYIHRGGFEFVNAALWTERKLMKFHLNPYFYSSLIHKDEPGLFIASYYVPTITADDLRSIAGPFLGHVDFISLDIEGADILVFPSLVEAFKECKLFCVEHANSETVKASWREMVEKYTLQIVAETPENYLLART